MPSSGEIKGQAEISPRRPGRGGKAPAPPTGGGARVRRHRERQRRGIRHVVLIEVQSDWLAALIRARWLDAVEAEDRAVVADAIEDILDCYSRELLRPDPRPAR